MTKKPISAIIRRYLRVAETDSRGVRLLKLALITAVILGFCIFGFWLGLQMGTLWTGPG